jgi:hypothetical protein
LQCEQAWQASVRQVDGQLSEQSLLGPPSLGASVINTQHAAGGQLGAKSPQCVHPCHLSAPPGLLEVLEVGTACVLSIAAFERCTADATVVSVSV